MSVAFSKVFLIRSRTAKRFYLKDFPFNVFNPILSFDSLNQSGCTFANNDREAIGFNIIVYK